MYRLLCLTLLLLLPLLTWQEAVATDKTQARLIYRRVIDSIQIEGNEAVSDADIERRMYARTRNMWLSVKGDRRSRIQRETLNRDTLEIKYLYLSLGYLNVGVKESFELLLPDSTALVKVEINEGRRFYYSESRVTGTVTAGLWGKIDPIRGRFKPGAPVNPFEVKTAEIDIKTVMANNGYPYATVLHSIDTTGTPDQCPVLFTVQADSLVHFGEVQISGSENFPEYAARRELKITPGDVYSREDILESQRRLFESGYYTTFQLRPTDSSPDRLRPDFDLRLRERKKRNATLKFGAGTSEVRDLVWNSSASYGQRNFLGSRRYDLLADYSFSLGQESRLVTHRYRIRFTEPWFLGIRMPVTLTGEFHPRLKDIEQEFDKSYWAASVSVTKYFQRRVIKLLLGLEYQNVDYSNISDITLEDLLADPDNRARRKLYGTIRRDSRDDLFIPRYGTVTELSAEYYGGFMGGDDDFYKLQGLWSRYRVIWPGWISATRLRGGVAEAFGQNEQVPADEALYLGGANTVRGFRENRLGPINDSTGVPEGYRYGIVFNQEFRWRTVQILNVFGHFFETFPLWQSVFVDVGNGFRDRIRFDELAVAYGTGVQIVSPAGPIRIDYARVSGINNFEVAHRWHFSILYAF